jgi:hypothetical protein
MEIETFHNLNRGVSGCIKAREKGDIREEGFVPF